jgi:dTDP-4-amino-4,6-dideoxygalactose transaminase
VATFRIPILDVVAQNKALSPELFGVVARVAESGRFILGEEVERFEQRVSESLRIRHAVGMSSGSDALVCALAALDVGPGDEVITTPFSFFATVEAVLRVGAVPRFVDVCHDTLELDPELVEAAIGPRTRAILAVELYGEPGRIDRLSEIAARRGLPLVEDAAQAFGAKLRGRAVGTFGAVGCFSFQPTKPLGAWGDAGMLVTNDDALAARCRRARVHGAAAKHRHAELGGNYRLDALQAAVLELKLGSLPGWIAARRAHALAYSTALARTAGLVAPPARAASEPSHSLYTLRVLDERRGALARALAEQGIETAIHYPIPLHRQEVIVARGFGGQSGSLPVAERAAREVLSLPLYPELSDSDRRQVIAAIGAFMTR